MKYRLLSLILSLLLYAAMVLQASADILWEPSSDTYYDYEKADTIAQIYVVPEGSTVNLYRSPTTSGVIRSMESGARIYVGFTQEFDGELWGIGYPLGDYKNEGWFRMNRLQQEYNHQMFYDDFGDSFTEYNGQLDGYEIQDAIRTWTYPGSGLGDGMIYQLSESYPLSCQYVYTDPDGGQWGYVGYHMGRCGWIWLDDPENPTPPVFTQTPENTVTELSPEAAPTGGLIWILVPVAAVVLATAAAIVILKRKKASQP